MLYFCNVVENPLRRSLNAHYKPTCTVAIIDMSTAAIIDVTTIAASSSSSRRCLCSPGALRLLHDPQSWLHSAPAALTWLRPPRVAPPLLLPTVATAACGAHRSSDHRLAPASMRASFFMCATYFGASARRSARARGSAERHHRSAARRPLSVTATVRLHPRFLIKVWNLPLPISRHL